ncbi:MAG: hypothetical protein BEH78_18980 [Pseudomonas sp. BDAL1]|nr:hypothetical protein [Pseudomonas savastanoi pv. phaseolicola]MBN4182176.1 hypothetical protein [Pseudomonas savastanoi pv. phaseolicola]ODS46304.1 MAG: hypothetical protein BEH78_18980 [Pseudomonas sp. BDAL1]QDW00616.1 hypothetical protein FFH21_012775 [Pseudomonas sp. KBS0707]
MKLQVVVLIALALSGCANHPGDCALGVMQDDCLPGTKGYERRHERIDAYQEATRRKAQADDSKCQSYGAKPGSDAYVNCRVQLDK